MMEQIPFGTMVQISLGTSDQVSLRAMDQVLLGATEAHRDRPHHSWKTPRRLGEHSRC